MASPSPTGVRGNDPTTLILSSLADGDKHGYGLLLDIERFAGVRLGPGTLYGAIARLEERGLIEPVGAEGRRRPYRLTPGGAQALQASLDEMRAIAEVGLARLARGARVAAGPAAGPAIGPAGASA